MTGVFLWLVDALKAVIWWIISSMRGLGDSLVSGVLGMAGALFPDMAAQLVLWEEWAAWANHFFPLSETLVLLTAYSSLWIAVVSVRIVKSLIPTLSN